MDTALPRGLPALFAAGAGAMLGLLVAHPHQPAGTLGAMLEFEARHRVTDGIVHGGTIVVLVLLVSAHATLARLSGPLNLGATVAVAAFGAGSIAMAASLMLDGFAVPALAVKYGASLGASVHASIQTQLDFCGTMIRILMPAALLFFAGSALAWAHPLTCLCGRLPGVLCGAIGALVGALIEASPPTAFGHAVIGGFLLVALWQFVFAAALRGNPPNAAA